MVHSPHTGLVPLVLLIHYTPSFLANVMDQFPASHACACVPFVDSCILHVSASALSSQSSTFRNNTKCQLVLPKHPISVSINFENILASLLSRVTFTSMPNMKLSFHYYYCVMCEWLECVVERHTKLIY